MQSCQINQYIRCFFIFFILANDIVSFIRVCFVLLPSRLKHRNAVPISCLCDEEWILMCFALLYSNSMVTNGFVSYSTIFLEYWIRIIYIIISKTQPTLCRPHSRWYDFLHPLRLTGRDVCALASSRSQWLNDALKMMLKALLRGRD